MRSIALLCPNCMATYEAHLPGPEYPPLHCRICGNDLQEMLDVPTHSADHGEGEFALTMTHAPHMELRVWLDDDLEDRAAPAGWIHVTTAREAIELIHRGEVVELSLDNDLGDDDANGRGIDVVDFIVEQQEVHGRDLWPRDGITLHTANPSGRDAMARAIRRYASKTMAVEELLTPGGKPRFRFRPKVS